MASQNTIRILVNELDELEDVEIKGMVSKIDLESLKQKVVDISLDTLKKSIDGALSGVLAVLSQVTTSSEDFEVCDIHFTLQIDSSGEVSLASLAKGSIGGQSTLEFTITRRKQADGN